MNIKYYGEGLKKHWKSLLQIALFIGMTVGGLITPPKSAEPVISTSQMSMLALFLITISAGIFIIIVKLLSKSVHLSVWIIIAVIFLLSAFGSLFYFLHLKSIRTCQFLDQEIAIGSVYTLQGQKNVEKDPNISCNDLLMNFAGRAEHIWTAESINSARLWLAGVYLLTYLLFALCMMSIVQPFNSYAELLKR